MDLIKRFDALRTDGRKDNVKTVYPQTQFAGGGGGGYNSVNCIQGKIKVKGQKLATVTSFMYLVAIVSDEGSKPEILSMIA